MDRLKRQASKEALKHIKDGMIIGLGSGTTIAYFIEELGKLVSSGLNIKVLCSSLETVKLVKRFNIPLVFQLQKTDIYIDGADYLDDNNNVIKGYGGALLREKLIMLNSKEVVLIMDDSKLTNDLSRHLTPIEVVPFSLNYVKGQLDMIGLSYELRMNNEEVFINDNQNYILDVGSFNSVNYEDKIKMIEDILGVVVTGYFKQVANIIIIANTNETITIRTCN